MVSELQRILDTLREKNIGILITDHNYRETLESTDRAYVIFEGRVLKEGNPEELLADSDVRRVYLGERAGESDGSG